MWSAREIRPEQGGVPRSVYCRYRRSLAGGGSHKTRSALVRCRACRGLFGGPPAERPRLGPLDRQRRLAVAEPAAARQRLHRRLLPRCQARLAGRRRRHLPYLERRRQPDHAGAPPRLLQGHHVRRCQARLGGRLPGRRENRQGGHLPHDQRRQELGPRALSASRRDQRRQLRQSEGGLGGLRQRPCCTPSTAACTGSVRSHATVRHAPLRAGAEHAVGRGSPAHPTRSCAPSTEARPGSVCTRHRHAPEPDRHAVHEPGQRLGLRRRRDHPHHRRGRPLDGPALDPPHGHRAGVRRLTERLGHRGAVYHTTDGGAHWVRQPPLRSPPGALPSRPQMPSSVGMPYGPSLSQRPTAAPPGSRAHGRPTATSALSMRCSSSTPPPAGPSARPARSSRPTDGGVIWSAQARTRPRTSTTRTSSTRDDGWIVGDQGVILHTTDGGATWTPQTSGVTDDLAGVTFVDAQHGWAVGGTIDERATPAPVSSSTRQTAVRTGRSRRRRSPTPCSTTSSSPTPGTAGRSARSWATPGPTSP